MKKIILISIFFFVLSAPSTSHAQVYFGAFVSPPVWPYVCTCSTFQTIYSAAPIYFGPVATAGLVTAYPGVMFPYYALHGSQFALGRFTPGTACWVWAGKSCFYVPTLGSITPYTGTSM